VIGDNSGDYIPAHGFLHKSSAAWPPPTDEHIEKAKDEQAADPTDTARRDQSNESLSLGAKLKEQMKSLTPNEPVKEEAMGFEVVKPTSENHETVSTSAVPQKGVISVKIDGAEVRIKDQIQLSPVLQGSLGGLPPMMILVGGSEVLRDEQIYFAHKAANPKKYPPPSHAATAEALASLDRWKRGTDVFLQVHENCCKLPLYLELLIIY
jgi:acetyl esterase/lipase